MLMRAKLKQVKRVRQVKQVNSILGLILVVMVMGFGLIGCSKEEKDISVSDVQIKPVKEVGDSKKEEQVLQVDGVELVDEFKNFDEAHFKSDSINIYDESTYVYIELDNKDYQSAYIDYLDYMSGRYPSNASCTVKKNNYILWEGRGYRFGIQINPEDENKNLYLFKWTDDKTKIACNNGLERLYEASEEKLDIKNGILDDLDIQYPNVDEELREVFHTNKGLIEASDGSIKIELDQNNINEIQGIIENSTVDVGDSIQDLNLDGKYYIVTLRSDDGVIEYTFVADDSSREFYIKEGRIIDIDEDNRQKNSLNTYLFSLIK